MTFMSSLKQFWQHEPAKFVTAYVLSGLLIVLIPAFKHLASVRRYQNSYYYQYNQNGDDQNENGSGDWTDVNNCQFWKFWCTSLYMNANGEYREQEADENGNYYSSPSWFSGWGGGQQSGDRASGDTNANAASLKFVYAWQLIMFFGLLTYGAMVLFKFRGALAQSRMALWSLFVLLFVWMNFSFLLMWVVANGSIYTDGRELEAVGGFYNQFSVLLFVSNFWFVIWSLGFCIALGCRIFSNKNGSSEAANEALNNKPGDSMNYLPYSEPSVTVTGVSTGNLPAASTSSKTSSWYSEMARKNDEAWEKVTGL